MSDDALEDVLRRIVRGNKEARARFAGLAARTSSAVVAGGWDDLVQIVKEASDDGNGDTDAQGIDPNQGEARSP